MRKQQGLQKHHHDNSFPLREFGEGQAVWAKNFAAGPKWLSGTVHSRSGPLSYEIKLHSGSIARRHVDHIRRRIMEPESAKTEENRGQRENPSVDGTWVIPLTFPSGSNEGATSRTVRPTSDRPLPPPNRVMEPPRGSSRARTQPAYLKDYVCKK